MAVFFRLFIKESCLAYIILHKANGIDIVLPLINLCVMKWREHTKEFLVGIQAFPSMQFAVSLKVLQFFCLGELPWWVIIAGILKNSFIPVCLGGTFNNTTCDNHCLTIYPNYGRFCYIMWGLTPVHTIYWAILEKLRRYGIAIKYQGIVNVTTF